MPMIETLCFFVQGRVQGVGFRPFVSQLACSLGLKGYVRNIGLGVEIVIQGKRKEEFSYLLCTQLPEVAYISSLEKKTNFLQAFEEFTILSSSQNDEILIHPIPDFGICEKCQKDILDPYNKRFFYPLINCTHCGPRFTVIRNFPYDRQYTSMQNFTMCKDCNEEYMQVQSRFFHAQPISCPKCGPKLFWKGEEIKNIQDVFQEMKTLLANSEILCIQGIGGFHLVCDAEQEKAILKLRALKSRPTKPFALMCKDLAQVAEFAYLLPQERELLKSKEAPIVLLQSKKKLLRISRDRYGIMLPYTPFYQLLFQFISSPLVVTSANLKGEPLIYQEQALQKLGIPYVFSHQREIIAPVEDSIVQVFSTGDISVLRHGRGYAPLVFELEEKLSKPMLAMGGNQKVSFAFAFDRLLIFSPYIGDLDNLGSISALRERIEDVQRVYKINFEEIVCDLHPQYESTKLAYQMCSTPLQIQHHYAHLLSVYFEHHLKQRVLGFCFDGTGYGSDGKIWGGEVLVADTSGFDRVFHFRYFPLLGGEVAIKDIARIAWSVLGEKISDDQKREYFIQRGWIDQELKILETMQKHLINSPMTSSVGRIFDAIAWFCGLEQQTYEGESGEMIQSLYDASITESYGIKIEGDEIVLDFVEIFQDRFCEPSWIASKFINALIEIVEIISSFYSYEIVLCGGVFCNRILSSKLLELFAQKGRKCHIGNKIPPNDNGLAVGQLYYLMQRSKNER